MNRTQAAEIHSRAKSGMAVPTKLIEQATAVLSAPKRAYVRYLVPIPSEGQARIELARDLARGNTAKANRISVLPLFEVAMNGGEGMR